MRLRLNTVSANQPPNACQSGWISGNCALSIPNPIQKGVGFTSLQPIKQIQKRSKKNRFLPV